MLKLIENGNLIINFAASHCCDFNFYGSFEREKIFLLHKVSYFVDIGINGTRILITSQVYLLDARETNPETYKRREGGRGQKRSESRSHFEVKIYDVIYRLF